MDACDPGPLAMPETSSSPAPSLSVEIVRRGEPWDDETLDPFLTRAARAAYDAAGGEGATVVSLLLGADADIRALNASWRGRDEPTNVLSFPLDAPHFGDGPRVLGDVALAFETVAREAGERGIPLGHHAAHLVVHGVLHLMGLDHAGEKQAREMEALEVKVLASLGLPDPYDVDMIEKSAEQ